SIEHKADMLPLRPDDILVPALSGQRFFELGRRLHQDLVAPAFVIKAAPVFFADVGLVTRDFAAPVDACRAKLNAGISFSLVQPKFQPQLEVAVTLFGRQKLVSFDAGPRVPHDHRILDLPEVAVTLPAGQRLAVEKRDESLFGGLRRLLVGGGASRRREWAR